MIESRCALPTDDLSVLWPNTSQRKLNLEQVLVLVDGPDILAGAIFFDAGHDVCFVAEARVIAPPAIHPFVAKDLHDAIWTWMFTRGKTLAMFHCAPGTYPIQLQRMGARVIAANMMLLTIDLDRPDWKACDKIA